MVCLEYTSPLIENNIHELSRNISQYIPEFKLNIGFRSLKVRKLFSYQAKPVVENFEKSKVVYEFLCSCNDLYIGETNRTLLVPLKQHQHTSSNICAHMQTFDRYKIDAQQFVDKNKLS